MVIITGAARGIGKYLFEYFDRKGQVLGLCHSSDEGNDRLSKVDIRDYARVDQWKNTISSDLPKEVVLINCAGISYSGFAHKCDIEAWQNVIQTNLSGTFNVIRAFLPLMRDRGYGRIINFSSVVAQKGVPGTSAYAASKAGLWGLAKALAAENACKGITVNNLNLGYSEIGMGLTEISPAHRIALFKQIPAGRFGAPGEILSAVELLIQNEYINGASIDINGALV